MFHCGLNTTPFIVSEYVTFFFFYYVHFESTSYRNSRSQTTPKINAFKSFAKFTGKQPCWTFFVMKLPACQPANLLKRDFDTDVFGCFLRKAFFIKCLP